jgi:hypothetical protein
LNLEPGTLKWWMKENPSLLNKLLSQGDHTERSLLLSFGLWLSHLMRDKKLDKKSLYLWGNGIMFDNQKIKTKYESLGMNSYPIYYRNDRDLRTLLELASIKSGKSQEEIKEETADKDEVKHNAIDDVYYQIRIACYSYELIMH